MLAIVLPITPLRVWPTVSGPVGLALTHSTWARLPRPMSRAKTSSPAARIASICASSQDSSRRMLRKPGGATSTAATKGAGGMWRAMLAATSSGLRRASLASCMATGLA